METYQDIVFTVVDLQIEVLTLVLGEGLSYVACVIIELFVPFSHHGP